MRFLVDECTGVRVAQWLREQNHEVFSVYEQARGMNDEKILEKAIQEKWILVTNDKGFGERIFREKHMHNGVIFLRLMDERSVSKVQTIKRFLYKYADKIDGRFAVVSETKVRFARSA
ncbi:MAG: DUF5615 family PIN-like protein [Deferribacteres bacterium]|nr:DUF5615 family PIN-like protein [candidate division KSB1 bacterium]MCB9500300.1 DUF5615 family PIN-like protein [Deferribacteres bacterium]